ncbi:MAG: hypothetical protein AB7E18_17415 [Stutzerimonas sp.]|uniref:hypothetical protein n=1 Tax=Stutzerimonas sp. TaxID=2901166 RepID=UPI003D1284FB
MNTIKQHALLAFGLTAALSLNTAYAQSEHDGHHPANAPAAQAAQQASQPKAQGGMRGTDHDKMQDMHDQHMGNGQMMDHGSMGQGQMMDHDGAMPKEMPKPAEKGNQHAH